MGNYSNVKSWDVQERLSYLENCALWLGRVNRRFICDRFQISLQQASADIQSYHELNPKALHYDIKAKCYFPSSDFHPILVSLVDPRSALNEFFPTKVDSVLIPPRKLELNVLRSLSVCLYQMNSIEIDYFSIHSNTRKKRRIAPCAFASDGLRWHVRAWCFNNSAYRDFLPSRIVETGSMEVFDFPIPDNDWDSKEEIEFIPAQSLDRNSQKAVKLDYSMEQGSFYLQTRVAMKGYTLRRLNFIELATVGHVNTSGTLEIKSIQAVQ